MTLHKQFRLNNLFSTPPCKSLTKIDIAFSEKDLTNKVSQESSQQNILNLRFLFKENYYKEFAHKRFVLPADASSFLLWLDYHVCPNFGLTNVTSLSDFLLQHPVFHDICQSFALSSSRFRAYGLQTLIGNAGGYVGLFLGWAVIQVPGALLHLITYLNGAPIPQ